MNDKLYYSDFMKPIIAIYSITTLLSYMKQLLTAVLLFSFFAIQAQTLDVKSISEDPIDLSALIETRKDNNGNACALIKIVAPNVNYTVQGSIIGEVDKKGSETWCYIPQGTKMIKIVPDVYDPIIINFEKYGIEAIESKKTYYLKLTNNGMDINEVVIKVTPANAMLAIDSNGYDLIEGKTTVNLSIGEHTYMAMAQGFESQANKFYVKKEGPNKIIIELDPKDDAIPVTLINQNVTASQGAIQNDGNHFTPIHVPDAVDLGLSVKWADCNLGATDPYSPGNLYLWGNIEPNNQIYKSNVRKDVSFQGSQELDAATAALGGKWKTPNKKQIEELKKKCKWEFTERNGTKGFLVTSKQNGNSIFIKTPGDVKNGWGHTFEKSSGMLWSSTPEKKGKATALWFFKIGIGGSNQKFYKFPQETLLEIRPVCEY